MGVERAATRDDLRADGVDVQLLRIRARRAIRAHSDPLYQLGQLVELIGNHRLPFQLRRFKRDQALVQLADFISQLLGR